MAVLQMTFTPTEEDFRTVNTAATFNTATIVLIAVMAVVSLGTVLALALGWLPPDPARLPFYILPSGLFVFFLVFTPIDLRHKAGLSTVARH